MNSLIPAVKNFVADEDGVTAIEYGLIAALVGLALAAGAKVFSAELSAAFSAIATTVTTAANAL